MENWLSYGRTLGSLSAAKGSPHTGQTSLHVLVVDDNGDFTEMMTQLLEISGHRTETVHNGLEVLDAARNFLPDVILMDIGLPGRNGYEVAKLIRADRMFYRTWLVALTGWDGEADRRAAAQAGFDVHLAKPVDPASLLEVLGRFPPSRYKRGTKVGGTVPVS